MKYTHLLALLYLIFGTQLYSNDSLSQQIISGLFKPIAKEAITSGTIMGAIVGTTVAYGFVNTQITFRNCPEYFTKGMLAHKLRMATCSPPFQGIPLSYCILPEFIYNRLPDDKLDKQTVTELLDKKNIHFIARWWGINRTWGLGAKLALPIVLAARMGPWPEIQVQDLVKPLAVGVACIGCAELIAGTIGYYSAKNNPQYQRFALDACAANDLSDEVANRYIANAWAVNALYTGGAIASGTLTAYILAKRLEYI